MKRHKCCLKRYNYFSLGHNSLNFVQNETRVQKMCVVKRRKGKSGRHFSLL